MSKKDYKITAEGIIPERPHALLLYDLENREKCPEAFLFTADETKQIYKARDAIIAVSEKYKDIPEKNYNAELEAQILAEYSAALGRKKAQLQKLTEKLKTALYWSAAIFEVKFFGKYGIKPFERYTITTSAPEQYPARVIDPDTCPAFYNAETTADKARALDIPDLYFYASKTELSALDTIAQIFKRTEENRAAAPVKVKQSDTFYSFVNSKMMTALDGVGANARNPEIKKKPNETGRQMSIAEYCSYSGVKVILNDFAPNIDGLLSVAEPNTNKLLYQAQILTIENKQKEQIIPLNDFMEFRHLSDRKTAIEKADKAATNLGRTGLDIDISDREAAIKGRFNYTQKCFLVTRPGRQGSYIYLLWSDDVYKHIIDNSERGQHFEHVDKKIMGLPDNQQTAIEISMELTHHLRRNAGRRNDHIIGVDTLIKHCYLLPLYPESPEDAGKDNYLRFKSEAPARIIKPFIKGLDFITADKQKNKDFQILASYTFKHAKGGAVSPAELAAALKDYKKFTALNIEYKFINEPNYERLIEKKAQQQEKAEQQKAKKQK